MSEVYFKKGFIPAEQCHISPNDRSFRFGDGLFETMLVHNGTIYQFSLHLQRLNQGLKALAIDLDSSKLPFICAELLKRNRVETGCVRIIISRGEEANEAFGYLPKHHMPYMLVQAFSRPYPETQPITLWLSHYKACSLFGFKSNNALLYSLAMQEAKAQACDNALLLDEQGNIAETASGNIFWIKDNVLYTPSLDLPLIAGTMRNRILALWQGEKQEGIFAIETLAQADGVFMSNTGVILAPVTALKPLGLNFSLIPAIQHLRQLLDKEIGVKRYDWNQ